MAQKRTPSQARSRGEGLGREADARGLGARCCRARTRSRARRLRPWHRSDRCEGGPPRGGERAGDALGVGRWRVEGAQQRFVAFSQRPGGKHVSRGGLGFALGAIAARAAHGKTPEAHAPILRRIGAEKPCAARTPAPFAAVAENALRQVRRGQGGGFDHQQTAQHGFAAAQPRRGERERGARERLAAGEILGIAEQRVQNAHERLRDTPQRDGRRALRRRCAGLGRGVHAGRSMRRVGGGSDWGGVIRAFGEVESPRVELIDLEAPPDSEREQESEHYR